MVRRNYIPERADLVWLDFSPQVGREQSGYRPAVVISNNKYNVASQLVLLCPITSKIKGYPFEVVIKAKKVEGVVMADQIKSFDWVARKITYAGKVDDVTMTQISNLVIKLISGTSSV